MTAPYDSDVIVIGDRRRNQPPPPHVVFEALTQPHRDPRRPWLLLLGDEQEPEILEAVAPDLVVWSSLWPHRPSARIRFEISTDGRCGSALRWILTIELNRPGSDGGSFYWFPTLVGAVVGAA